MRSSARKQGRNRAAKSRLKTLERNLEDALAAGKKSEAGQAYRLLSSALDKTAKTGVVHKSTASRKKSRLGVRLARLP